MPDQFLSHLSANPSSVTFLVGENGAGKSKRLASLATELLASGQRVIAISNTAFDRFPRSRQLGYARLSPSVGKRYAAEVFKRALTSTQSDVMRNASLIAKTLQYTGFQPVLGLHVRIKQQADYSKLSSTLSEYMPEAEISRVARALDIYRNYGNYRQSAWIDLYGAEIGPDRRELLILLKHESKLKRLGIIERISLTIERDNSIFDFDEASSGELSLLASHAFIATYIQEGDFLLIDEPENSLHPRWQRDYCRRILDQFYYYSPRVIIASHSPHIVQGAQSSEVDVRLIKLPSNEVAPAPLIKSIEGTLFEAFGVLSPASHYLSEKVAHLLNELVQKRTTLDETQRALRDLQILSSDSDQQAFLDRTISLAERAQGMLDTGSQ
jgi:predicted ATPase